MNLSGRSVSITNSGVLFGLDTLQAIKKNKRIILFYTVLEHESFFPGLLNTIRTVQYSTIKCQTIYTDLLFLANTMQKLVFAYCLRFRSTTCAVSSLLKTQEGFKFIKIFN